MPPTQNTESSAQCPRCGSPWFAKLKFQQYADQTYSSTVGGSLSPLTNDPQYARVCLCGMLCQPTGYIPRGHRLTPDEQSFLDSRKKAQEYQQRQNEAEERTQKQLRAAANPEYIKQLSARVESAEQLIAQLAAELQGRHLKSRRKPGRSKEP
jgi:hypothetical protein